MKAAFIHDHYFVHDDKTDKYYDGSGGVFNFELWKRYLSFFDELTVVGRAINKLPNRLVLSSSENVKFALIDDIKSSKDKIFKQEVIREKLNKVIDDSDFLIIRVPSTLGYHALSICKSKKKRYVLEIVGCPWDAYWNYGTLLAKMLAPYEMLKLKKAALYSDACIYVTKAFLQNRYPTNGLSESISNVKIDEIIDRKSVLDFYNRFILNAGETFKIGLIGSFHVKYKGHIEAIEAIRHIVQDLRISNIKLYLVGTGNSEWILDIIKEKKISDFIEVVGTVDAGKDGIIPFLDTLHLYMHPSKQEGLPRVVLEAMSRGRLCLASSVAGTPELLDDRFLHKPGDWRKLAKDIIKLYKDHGNWNSIIVNNIATSTGYTEEFLQQKRISFLKKINAEYERRNNSD